jgi:hypothetical protein
MHVGNEANDVYVSWVGVVENIDDPLKNGRVKVRIFGWHTEDLIKLPTAVLPWATVTQNSTGTFVSPIPGDFVNGYFADGISAQNPFILSVLPGVRDLVNNPWDTSKGFSPQPLFPGEPAEPNAPVVNPAIADAVAKNPTTNSYISKGIVANTGISLTNSSLSHVCDFRYQLDFNIGLSGLINPVTAITQAIKNGKNNAANFIAMMIKKLNDTIRTTVKALISAMNLDPTGQVASVYAIVKAKLDDINTFIKQIAEYVEIASTIYYLIKDINQIVDYLKSLPARFLAIVQDCITRFLNGAKAFVSQVAAIPGQIGATVESLASSIQSGADSVLSGLNAEVNAVVIPDSLMGVFTNPELNHSNTVIEYISNTYGNANTIMATVEASNFDPNKVQWA